MYTLSDLVHDVLNNFLFFETILVGFYIFAKQMFDW